MICNVRVSPRSRYVRLEYRRGNLTITVPRAYRRENIRQLIQDKRRWIVKTADRYGSGWPESASRELQYGDTVTYLGMDLALTQYPGHNGNAEVVLEGNNLKVNAGSSTTLHQVVANWYKQQAERLFKKRVEEIAGELGIKCGQVTVRKARTRWGSCSRKRNLSLNWKLVMAPPPIIDYVIIHELLHIKEMNHSPRFWKLVDEVCPGWREHRRWLREHEIGDPDFVF